MSISRNTIAAILVSFLFIANAVLVHAKDLGNGWTEQDFKKHYHGCIKGAVSATLKKMLDEGKITTKTSEEQRTAIVNSLVDKYAPLCKCIQNGIVEQVNIKDIGKVKSDSSLVRNISQTCVKQHMK